MWWFVKGSALSLLLCIVCGFDIVQSFGKKNCGLQCFRWQKCMGQVDGSASRPGQLGDTGVIVLNICDEGKCDCKAVLAEAAAQKKAKKTTTVKPTSSSRGSSGGGFTRGGGSSRFTPFRSRTRTRPNGGISSSSSSGASSPAPTTSSSPIRSRIRPFRPSLLRNRGSLRLTTTKPTTTTTTTTRPTPGDRFANGQLASGLSSSVKEKASNRLASLFASRQRPPKRVAKPSHLPTTEEPSTPAAEEILSGSQVTENSESSPATDATTTTVPTTTTTTTSTTRTAPATTATTQPQVAFETRNVVTCDDSGDICVVKQIQVPIQSPSESSRPERAVITGTSVSFSTSESSEESIEILQNPTKSELDENGQKVHVILPVTAEEPQIPEDARSRFRRFFKGRRRY